MYSMTAQRLVVAVLSITAIPMAAAGGAMDQPFSKVFFNTQATVTKTMSTPQQSSQFAAYMSLAMDAMATDRSNLANMAAFQAALPTSCVTPSNDDIRSSCFPLTTPTWYATLPPPVQRFMSSFYGQEISIYNAVVSQFTATETASSANPSAEVEPSHHGEGVAEDTSDDDNASDDSD